MTMSSVFNELWAIFKCFWIGIAVVVISPILAPAMLGHFIITEVFGDE